MSNIVYKADDARFSTRYRFRNGILYISMEDTLRNLGYAPSTIKSPSRRFKQEIDNGQVIKQQIAGSKKLEHWVTQKGYDSFSGRSRKPKDIKQALKDLIERGANLIRRYEQQEADLDQFISDTIDKAFATNEAASTTITKDSQLEQTKAQTQVRKQTKSNSEPKPKPAEWYSWIYELKNMKRELSKDTSIDVGSIFEKYYDSSNTYWREYFKWMWMHNEDPDFFKQEHDRITECKKYRAPRKYIEKVRDVVQAILILTLEGRIKAASEKSNELGSAYSSLISSSNDQKLLNQSYAKYHEAYEEFMKLYDMYKSLDMGYNDMSVYNDILLNLPYYCYY